MSENLTHLVFDIETLGLKETAVILAIACVPFTLEVETNFEQLVRDGLMVKFNTREQLTKYGRTCCKSTIDWWKSQNESVRESIIKPSSKDVTVVEGCQMIADFIDTTSYSFKKSYVWSRGTYFDFPKIEHLYNSSGDNVPYNGWKIRDIRTYIDILCGRSDGQYKLRGDTSAFQAHNCLHDAAMDAARMNEIFKDALGGGPITDDDIPF